jgi:hypothetical protein
VKLEIQVLVVGCSLPRNGFVLHACIAGLAQSFNLYFVDATGCAPVASRQATERGPVPTIC